MEVGAEELGVKENEVEVKKIEEKGGGKAKLKS